MSIEYEIEKMRNIQKAVLEFVEKDKNSEENYENVKKLLSAQKIMEDKAKLKSVLRMMTKIGSNHQRVPRFIEKVELVYEELKSGIVEHFTNEEIFEIFGSNKRILLYAIKEHLVKLDVNVFRIIMSKDYIEKKYPHYFIPEISMFLLTEITQRSIENLIEFTDCIMWIGEEAKKVIPDVYEKKRLEGENDNYICELIRKSKLKEFVMYVNKEGLSLDSYIPVSIFETNPLFLNVSKTSIIEYAAFYGSNEIIHYLVSNDVPLKPSMWIYCMHTESDELIHYLEDQKITPGEDGCEEYEEILRESIKCHHNDLTMFIISNLINKKDLKFNTENNFYHNYYRYSIEYDNYCFFPEDMKYKYLINYLCEFGYYTIVKFI